MPSIIAKSLIAGSVALISSEHITRIYNIKYRPSTGIIWIADKSKIGFTKAGSILVSLSSFYNVLKLDQLAQTLWDIAEPTVKLCISPVYMISGYLEKLKSYTNQKMILCGTATLALLLVYRWKYYHIYPIHINHFNFQYKFR